MHTVVIIAHLVESQWWSHSLVPPDCYSWQPWLWSHTLHPSSAHYTGTGC